MTMEIRKRQETSLGGANKHLRVTRRQPITALVQNSSFRTALYMGGSSSGRLRRLKKPSYRNKNKVSYNTCVINIDTLWRLLHTQYTMNVNLMEL